MVEHSPIILASEEKPTTSLTGKIAVSLKVSRLESRLRWFKVSRLESRLHWFKLS